MAQFSLHLEPHAGLTASCRTFLQRDFQLHADVIFMPWVLGAQIRKHTQTFLFPRFSWQSCSCWAVHFLCANYPEIRRTNLCADISNENHSMRFQTR